MNWKDIIHFWFLECKPEQWFQVNKEFDALITSRYEGLLEKASKSELASWRTNLEGRLAEIIVLDQFSRNIYRDKPKSFQQDPLALSLAKDAIKDKEHLDLETVKKSFLYMPFMHSENLADHLLAVELFSQPGLEYNLGYEMKHKKIIERFGRYPHRNKILGRESSPEEIAFLKLPDSSF